MTKKSKRLGIKFPNKAEVNVYSCLTRTNGLVYGLTHSNKHITLIDEGNAISGHVTKEDTKENTHIGKIAKNEMTEKLILEIFKLSKLKDSELDQTMRYFTKKYVSFWNMLVDMFFKTTNDKSMSYLNLDVSPEHFCSLIKGFHGSADTFSGYCAVRQMLLSDDIEFGMLENRKFIVRIDNQLHEMDLSLLWEALFMQSGSTSGNPLLNMMRVFGIAFIQENLSERLRELASKTLQNENEENPESNQRRKTN